MPVGWLPAGHLPGRHSIGKWYPRSRFPVRAVGLNHPLGPRVTCTSAARNERPWACNDQIRAAMTGVVLDAGPASGFRAVGFAFSMRTAALKHGRNCPGRWPSTVERRQYPLRAQRTGQNQQATGAQQQVAGADQGVDGNLDTENLVPDQVGAAADSEDGDAKDSRPVTVGRPRGDGGVRLPVSPGEQPDPSGRHREY